MSSTWSSCGICKVHFQAEEPSNDKSICPQCAKVAVQPCPEPLARWYFSRDKRKHGPFSTTQIRLMAISGSLCSDDMILKEGATKWATLASIADLSPAIPASHQAIPIEPTTRRSSTDTIHSKRVWLAVALPAAAVLLVSTFILVLSNPGQRKVDKGDAAHREATWRYWQGLLKVTKKLNALEKDPRFKTFADKSDPKTPEEAITWCQQRAKACDQVADELRSSIRELEALPLLSVDSEVLEIGSMSLETLREARSILADMTPILREGVSLVEDGQSLGTLVEVVLVGNKRISDRQQKWEKITERLEDVSRKDKKIDSEIRRARIKLTQRYNKDFPSLD